MWRYANDKERRVAARERQRFRCAAVAFERVACNGAQHEETRCMIDITQRLLENAQKHARAHVVETERARQA